jgi:hypothetical protein
MSKRGRASASEAALVAVKVAWSAEEDEVLRDVVSRFGYMWRQVASGLPGRTGKQCRARWHNHLDPSVYRGPWTDEEDRLIIELVAKDGTQWANISRQLTAKGFHRTDMSIKNRYNSCLSRLSLCDASGSSAAESLRVASPKRASAASRATGGNRAAREELGASANAGEEAQASSSKQYRDDGYAKSDRGRSSSRSDDEEEEVDEVENDATGLVAIDALRTLSKMADTSFGATTAAPENAVALAPARMSGSSAKSNNLEFMGSQEALAATTSFVSSRALFLNGEWWLVTPSGLQRADSQPWAPPPPVSTNRDAVRT